MSEQTFQVITFYKFKPFAAGELPAVRTGLLELMDRLKIKGTVILAEEGFNSTIAGTPPAVSEFLVAAGQILETEISFKSSFHNEPPFRKSEVKIKHEIVTFRHVVDVSCGDGTHVAPENWNAVLSDPETVVLDTRNDYEFKNGTFKGAINPKTAKFSELPAFVSKNLDPDRDKKVAVFCTGGIRCEKFAAYLKERGFETVFQLQGGILRYLEDTPPGESLWTGECFVFDGRVTVDHSLKKGIGPDHSLEPLD